MSQHFANILQSLDLRVDEILDACIQCGACVEVCPTPGIEGMDAADPKQITSGILQILRDGAGPVNSQQWAEACCGTGACLSVCEHGINPRFMLNMARRALLKTVPLADRKQQGKDEFKKMSRGVRLISRLQLPLEILARLSPSSHPGRTSPPDLIFYTGCNMLKTPHIGLLCLDVLDQLDASYEVHGGPANCCGILQLRPGDDDNSVRQASKTIERFAATKTSKVVAWCPTCQIQFQETMLPGFTPSGPAPFDIEMLPVYLASRLDQLAPMLVNPVPKRVALHEYPGSIGVTEAVVKLLSAIPELEIIDLNLPRAGYQLSMLTNKDYAKKHLADMLRAAEAAEVTTLAGVFHADHREVVAHEGQWPFEVVNYMDLIGESMGLNQPDSFKHLKLMQDVDAILAETSASIAAHSLNLDDARDIIFNEILGEQLLPTDRDAHPV